MKKELIEGTIDQKEEENDFERGEGELQEI